MVAPSSKVRTVSSVFKYRYGVANVGVTNCLSHFSIFVPNQAIEEKWNVVKIESNIRIWFFKEVQI